MRKTLSQGSTPQTQMQAGITMYITALIVEHCDLESVAVDNQGEY